MFTKFKKRGNVIKFENYIYPHLRLVKTFLYSVANYEAKSQRFLALVKFKDNYTNQLVFPVY
jgi:hypothetical protein